MKSPIIAAALLAGAIPFAHAQSSVVLYGVAADWLRHNRGRRALSVRRLEDIGLLCTTEPLTDGERVTIHKAKKKGAWPWKVLE